MEERITTAGIVVEEGRLLVGRRRTEGSLIDGRWEFIGGKNRWGESCEETLRREFMEELGVEVSVGDYLTQIDFTNAGVSYHLKAYEVVLLSHDFKLSVHSTLSFLSPEEVWKLDLVDSDRRILSFLLHKDGLKE